MKSAKKLVILLVVLMAPAIGGVAFAATHSEPLLSVDPTVRHEPPEQELGVYVTVNRIRPRPKTTGVNVFFDREGNLDKPELVVSIGKPHPDNAFYLRFEETDEEPAIPSPTNGRVTEFAIKALDTTCNFSGVC